MSAAWLIPLFTSLASLVFGNSEADLVFVGDAMQHQAQLDAARKGKDYDYTGYFDDIKPFVSVADYAVVNLETPVSTPPYSGYPCFNAPPAFLDALADAGFDLFLTANNHTLDRGARGLRKTIEELDVRRLAHTGTFANDSARAESVPMIVNVNDFKIGVVVDYIDRPAIRRDVENSRKAGAELICVCVHWGDEYKLLPNASQRYLADFLEAIGVDMIIGGHPHVIQPMELRPNKYYPDKNILLVYSLGNFVSNMKTADTRGGALAHVKLFRGDDKKPMVQSAVYRLLLTIPGTPGSSNYRVMEADSVKDSAWGARAAEFSRRAPIQSACPPDIRQA